MIIDFCEFLIDDIGLDKDDVNLLSWHVSYEHKGVMDEHCQEIKDGIKSPFPCRYDFDQQVVKHWDIFKANDRVEQIPTSGDAEIDIRNQFKIAANFFLAYFPNASDDDFIKMARQELNEVKKWEVII